MLTALQKLEDIAKEDCTCTVEYVCNSCKAGYFLNDTEKTAYQLLEALTEE